MAVESNSGGGVCRNRAELSGLVSSLTKMYRSRVSQNCKGYQIESRTTSRSTPSGSTPSAPRPSTRASSTQTRPRTSPTFESLTRLFSVKINLFLLWTQISNFGHFGHFDFGHKSTQNPGAMPQLWHLTLATCPRICGTIKIVPKLRYVAGFMAGFMAELDLTIPYLD